MLFSVAKFLEMECPICDSNIIIEDNLDKGDKVHCNCCNTKFEIRRKEIKILYFLEEFK